MQNDMPTYPLGDHLGSTSITTFENGNLVSEMKYKAWGEVRYTSGATPTDYTYTGQYSNTGDFGLMFYNARWYDPALGRFAQADTIIPQNQGVQAWDRYAYSNNNPVRYDDPSGHCIPGCVIVGIIIVAVVVYAISVVERSREPAPPGGPVYLPTSTPTSTGHPPYKDTSTLSQDLLPVPWKTPTGTIPTQQPMLIQGNTSTPTIVPTSTKMPVDYAKIPEVIGNDIQNVEEACYQSGGLCGSALEPFPGAKAKYDVWEFGITLRDFVKSLDLRLPSRKIVKPPPSTSTGTPVVVPIPAPMP